MCRRSSFLSLSSISIIYANSTSRVLWQTSCSSTSRPGNLRYVYRSTHLMHQLKRFISISVLLFVLLAVFSLTMVGCARTQAAGAPPPPEVRVTTVIQQDVPVYSEWVATLDGNVNAQIRPQVSGYIVKQYYKEGSLVRKGQVLFEIDPRPFKAALD